MNEWNVYAVFWVGVFTVLSLHTIFMGAIRIIRARGRVANIAAHGWPKPPMDADGDIINPEGDEDND